MAEERSFNQPGQEVGGNQTNFGGNARDVLSGEFHGDVILDSSGASVSFPVPHQIALPPQDFTGREDVLLELAGLFERDRVIVGLRGMGGVGKTALAFALAEIVKDRFPDGQIFVSMMGTSPQTRSAAEAMAQVIRSYQPALRLPESEAELANLYRSELNGKRALLLLDNALGYEQVRPMLPPAECSLIVTSRRKFNLPGMTLKDLDVLKLDKAVELLLSTAGEDHLGGWPEKKSSWENLARLCGCLPVALRAAGSFLANTPDSSLEQYARELQDEKRRLERIGKEGVEEGLDLKLSLSFSRLPDETAQVFRQLSIFPSDFDSKADEEICQDEGHSHLSELLRWSLVEFQRPEPASEGRYHLHDLVRLFAASLSKKERNLNRRHAAYYQELLWKANSLLLQGGDFMREGLQLFDLEWTNIQMGQNWAATNIDEDLETARICSNFAWTGSILSLRLHPEENVRWLQAALSSARLIKSRDDEGVHLGNLGNAYVDLGKTRKAIEYYEQALTIAREIGDRRDEGNALGNMGTSYYLLGEPCKAIEYHDQALVIASEIGDRRGEGNRLGNLGLDYADLGEARKAIEYYEKALTIAREIGDLRGEGNRLGHLGIAYKNLGEPRKAIEHYDQALAIAREIGDRRGEGNRLGNLGLAYADLGEPRKAIEYYEQALAIDREIGDRRNEGAWLGNLGLAYADLGDARKAIEYYELQLGITREIGDRRGEANSLFNLSLALFDLGKHSEAIKYAESALQIYKQIESPAANRVKKQLAEWRK